jgi:hypothetical protein
MKNEKTLLALVVNFVSGSLRPFTSRGVQNSEPDDYTRPASHSDPRVDASSRFRAGLRAPALLLQCSCVFLLFCLRVLFFRHLFCTFSLCVDFGDYLSAHVLTTSIRSIKIQTNYSQLCLDSICSAWFSLIFLGPCGAGPVVASFEGHCKQF